MDSPVLSELDHAVAQALEAAQNWPEAKKRRLTPGLLRKVSRREAKPKFPQRQVHGRPRGGVRPSFIHKEPCACGCGRGVFGPADKKWHCPECKARARNGSLRSATLSLNP